MCNRPHPRGDCLCDAARLETFDPIADAQDAKRHARERAERAAAGMPEPTLEQMAKGFGNVRLCRWCYENEQVDGALCVKCSTARERGREWWAA